MWESKREEEAGGGRVYPTSAHPPIYGSPFQQGHSRWGGSVDALFSRVNSKWTPRLVCVGTTYLLRGPVELSVGLRVLHRPPLCLLRAFTDFPPKTCEWTEQPVTSSCCHPFNLTGVPDRLQPPDQNKCVYTRFNAFSGEHSWRFPIRNIWDKVYLHLQCRNSIPFIYGACAVI